MGFSRQEYWPFLSPGDLPNPGIHTIRGFSIVNEAEVDVFLEFLCFLYDPMDVGNLISGFSDLSKPSLYIWKFLIQVLLKTSLKDFEHNPTSIGSECNCLVT